MFPKEAGDVAEDEMGDRAGRRESSHEYTFILSEFWTIWIHVFKVKVKKSIQRETERGEKQRCLQGQSQ